MKSRTKIFGALVLSLILIANSGLILPAMAAKEELKPLDLSTPVVVRVDQDLPQKDLNSKISIVDESGNKVPILVTWLEKQKALIIPLFDMKGVKVQWKAPGSLVSWEPYTKQTYVGSQENFKYLMKIASTNLNTPMYYRGETSLNFTVPTEAPAAQAKSAASDGAADYTGTNVQVKGIDEGDTVKTDGKGIYTIQQNKIYIMQANPKDPKVLSSIGFADEKLSPLALYVEGDKLIVIGSSSNNYSDVTKIILYDIKDRTNPKVDRVLEQSGYYQHSRKNGSVLHVISDFRSYSDPIMPLYKDSSAGDKEKSISGDRIILPPGCISDSLSVIGSIDLKDKKEMDVLSIVGGADQLYMAEKSLYITYNKVFYTEYRPLLRDVTPGLVDTIKTALGIGQVEVRPTIMPGYYIPQSQDTQIKKFSMDKTKITFQAEGSVPGHLINQFAMDEYKGYFRVAYETYSQGKGVKSSAVDIFDANMKQVGRISDIAPEENMHSVRFMGEKAYMVTFKNVDPFFVLDLKDPKNPQTLGYLKIPGYSDYLHPVDENHILGFGKDTVEIKGTAYYLGLKVALFDVSDVNNPVVKNQVILGERGSETSLLYDHKALMYDGEKGVLAFPVSLTKVKEEDKKQVSDFPPYGEVNFQGAVVFKVSAKEGIQEQGRITQIQNMDPYNYDRAYDVQRILRVGDSYYTLSEKQIQANAVKDLTMEGKARIQ